MHFYILSDSSHNDRISNSTFRIIKVHDIDLDAEYLKYTFILYKTK